MDKVGFGTLNSIVLVLYLLAMLGVGMYFTKKAGESTEAFFKAGGESSFLGGRIFNLCNDAICHYIYGDTGKSI